MSGVFDLSTLSQLLPNSVVFNVGAGFASADFDSLFDIQIADDDNAGFLQGLILDGYCIDGDIGIRQDITPQDGITSQTYTARVYSSYDIAAMDAEDAGGADEAIDYIDKPQHLDLVNWIINQDFQASDFDGYDPSNGVFNLVQLAIWKLVDGRIPRDRRQFFRQNKDYVQQIIDLARENGNGFEPTEYGQKIAIALVPDDLSSDVVEANAQTVIAAVEISRIGDRVFEDLNANGIQDAGEPGIEGVTVNLLADLNGDGEIETGEQIATTTTDGDGKYFFDVIAGDYRVEFEQPEGFGVSPSSQGGEVTSEAENGIDLSVEKIFDIDTVTGYDYNSDGNPEQFVAVPNQVVAYTILVTNNSPSLATDVFVLEDFTNRLPVGLDFLDATIGEASIWQDTDGNLNTVELVVGDLAAGETVAIRVEASVNSDSLKTLDVDWNLGIANPVTGDQNADIPEYVDLNLSGQFYLNNEVTKAAGDKNIDIPNLQIQTETVVLAAQEDTSLENNAITTRLDVASVVLDGTLNNEEPVSIRTFERLGALSSDIAYSLNPDPVLSNGDTVVSFDVANAAGSNVLANGGTVTFTIKNFTGTDTNGNGIYGDDGAVVTNIVDSFSVTDGTIEDFEAIAGQVIANWTVDKSEVQTSNTVFQVETSVSGSTNSSLPVTSYFDEFGNAVSGAVPSGTPPITVDTSPALLRAITVNHINTFSFESLAVGGSMDFEIFDVTTTDDVTGILDYTAAGAVSLDSFTITDGATDDLDSDAREISTEFLIEQFPAGTDKSFAIVASTDDITSFFGFPSGTQTFVTYFDINGNPQIQNVNTSGNSTKFSLELVSTTTSNAGGDSAIITNDSDFLPIGGVTEDGLFDQFGTTVFNLFWNALENDEAYLSNIDQWEALSTETSTPEEVINFLFDNFLVSGSGVYEADNFAAGSLSITNQTGQTTTIEVLEALIEAAPDNGGGTPPGLEITFAELLEDLADSIRETNSRDSEGLLSEVITVKPGEFNPTADTGFYEFASVGDRLFVDANRNGLQDESETGLDGVTVRLIQDNEIVETTTTSNGGEYLFETVIPGDYQVEFDVPEGYELTLPNQGGDEALDSDANPATGLTDLFTLTSGEYQTDIDAGLRVVAKENCVVFNLGAGFASADFDSFFDVQVAPDDSGSFLQGKIWDGYCLDGDLGIEQDITPQDGITSQSYTAKVYSSYDLTAMDAEDVGGMDGQIDYIENPENLDLVNWIMNQDFQASDFDGYNAESGVFNLVQLAIWQLVDGRIPPDRQAFYDENKQYVDQIIALAEAKGEGFVATEAGQKVGVILVPVEDCEEPVKAIAQTVIVAVDISELDQHFLDTLPTPTPVPEELTSISTTEQSDDLTAYNAIEFTDTQRERLVGTNTADMFVFSDFDSSFERDVIKDFEVGDLINLEALGISDSELTLHENRNGHTVLKINGDALVVLKDVLPSVLAESILL